jgi:hypothetical protein
MVTGTEQILSNQAAFSNRWATAALPFIDISVQHLQATTAATLSEKPILAFQSPTIE